MKGFQEPLNSASLDLISQALHSIVDDNYSYIARAFAAELLLSIHIRENIDATELLNQTVHEAREFGDQIAKVNQASLVFHEDDRELVEKCHTTQRWIIHWPIPRHRYIHLRNLRPTHFLSGIHREALDALHLSPEAESEFLLCTMDLDDNPSDESRQSQYRTKYIAPNLEPDFLRTSNPLHCTKSSLSMQIFKEELGLNFANQYIQIFSMCHIYNALFQIGYINIEWPALVDLMHFHLSTLFLGELPKTAESMYTRILMCAGVSGKVLAKLKRERSSTGRLDAEQVLAKTKTRSKRSWDLQPSPTSLILREYFHGRDKDFMTTLEKLDKEMQGQSKDKHPKSFLHDLGTIPFLQELEKMIAKLMPRIQIDYLGLTVTCHELLHKMDIEFGNSRHISGDAMPEADWSQPSLRGFEIALSILGELEGREQILESTNRSNLPNPKAPMAEIAKQVLEEYLLPLSADDESVEEGARR